MVIETDHELDKILYRKKLKRQLRKVHENIVESHGGNNSDYEQNLMRQKMDFEEPDGKTNFSAGDYVSLDSEPQLWGNLSQMQDLKGLAERPGGKKITSQIKLGQFTILAVKNRQPDTERKSHRPPPPSQRKKKPAQTVT